MDRHWGPSHELVLYVALSLHGCIGKPPRRVPYQSVTISLDLAAETGYMLTMRRCPSPQMAADSGARPDPYVLNSRANALGSLGRWEGA